MEIWPFQFDAKKATQAVAVLLRHADPIRKQDNYTRVLKLLYIGEREALRRRGRPLLGDHVCAMKQGPVLSAVYDLILSHHFRGEVWNPFIEQSRFDIFLKADPGNDELSPYETKLLEEVADEHADKDQWQLIDLCHTFPEWIKRDPAKADGTRKSVPIELDDILIALGIIDRKASILEWAAEQRETDRLFAQTLPS